jgi:hypothetical protein
MSIISRRRMLSALAAAGLALPAVLGGTAAQADSKSNESQHDKICDAWYNVFERDVENAAIADRNNDEQGMSDALDEAEKDLATAQQAGCEWALRKAPSSGNGAPPVKPVAGP